MGLEPKDRDYVVVGATEQQMLDDGFVRVGASFPVFLKDGAEYALARTERKNGVGYKGFDVVFDPTVTLEDDLIRRDLTINSMAMDLETGEIIDPFNGQRDLRGEVLRATSDAFAEDPIRVLRTARFAARYDFRVSQATLMAMKRIVHEIDHVPQERVWAEFEKGLMEKHPSLMMDVLDDVEALYVSSLRPYSQWSTALHDVTDQTNMEVRFALLARGFTEDDYEWCKIPNHLARTSKSVNKHAVRLFNYLQLPAQERLDVLNDLRAFNDQAHVTNVLLAAMLMLPSNDHTFIASEVYGDIKKVKAVNLTRAPQLAMAAGMPVSEYVNLLRVQALQ
jgi:tRNA nucleotidyltransferase/poly(A) polymerase